MSWPYWPLLLAGERGVCVSLGIGMCDGKKKGAGGGGWFEGALRNAVIG